MKAKVAEKAVNIGYEAFKTGVGYDNKFYSYPTNNNISPSDNTRVVQSLYIK